MGRTDVHEGGGRRLDARVEVGGSAEVGRMGVRQRDRDERGHTFASVSFRESSQTGHGELVASVSEPLPEDATLEERRIASW